MKNMRRALAAAGVCALALGSGHAAAHATARASAAAQSCNAAGCVSVGPEESGCAADDNVGVVGHADGDGAHLELFYSPACKANWARLSGAPAGTEFCVVSENPAGDQQQCDTEDAGDTYTWTNMVDGTYTAYAYMVFPDGIYYTPSV